MNKIRYGVIGIKGVGKAHIKAARRHPQVELAALVDIDESFLQQKSAELGVRGFTDYRKMLDAGIVDAVSIATPHHLHGEMGMECLKAGVHCLVEKPLAIRVSEIDPMLKLAATKKLKICVGHQYRTFRPFARMKQVIDSGSIGKILRVLWTWMEFRPEIYFTESPWRADWNMVGSGIVMNHAIHHLDLLCWMVGKPVEVSAFIGNQLHLAELEDIACANILFADGAFASFQCSLNQPRNGNICQIAGDRGIVSIPDFQSLIQDLDDPVLVGIYEDHLPTLNEKLSGIRDQPAITWSSLKSPSFRSTLQKLLYRFHLTSKRDKTRPFSHGLLMENFIEAIVKDGEPLVSGESGRVAVELANGMLLSAFRKKTVALPLDPEEYDQVFNEVSRRNLSVPHFR